MWGPARVSRRPGRAFRQVEASMTAADSNRPRRAHARFSPGAAGDVVDDMNFLDFRTILSDIWIMRGNEFIKKVRRLAKLRGCECEWHPDKGKGSHGALTFGDKWTIVRNPQDELKSGTFHGMCKQLGIRPDEL